MQIASHLKPKSKSGQSLRDLTIGHLAHVLKHLPDRAAGPDGVPTQLLRTAPPTAHTGDPEPHRDVALKREV